MNKKTTTLVSAITAAWSQYELEAASVYAVQATAIANRDKAIADAIAEFDPPAVAAIDAPVVETPVETPVVAESTTEAAPLEENPS